MQQNRLALLILSMVVASSSANAEHVGSPHSSSALAVCREFADLSAAVFMRRDAGITESAQARDWEKVIAQHKEQATKRALMANILHYAYSPDSKAVTFKQARTEYFKGCRTSLAK